MQLLKLNTSQYKIKYFIIGFVFGLGFLSVFLFWIVNPFLVYEATAKYAILSLLLPLFLSIIFGISFILFKYIKNSFLKIISIPIILVFIEILISNLFYGFPWITFSLILSDNIVGLYLIKYFGTNYTSFIVLSIYMIPSLIIYRKN